MASQIVRSYEDLPTFTRDIEPSGRKAVCKAFSFSSSVPAPRVRVFFGLTSEETVIRYKPIAIVSSFLNAHLYHSLHQLSDIGDSLCSTLEHKYGSFPTQAQDSYHVAEISPKTAQLINQPESGLIIYSQRLAYLHDGTPVKFVESFIRTDKFRIKVDYKNHGTNSGDTASVKVNFVL